MLSIKPIGSTEQEVRYYSELGAAENHDYYSEQGERSGFWWGSGASQLGLSGEVQPCQFGNLLNGRSADGENSLVQARSRGQRKRRAGFDLTFSMPKSFSLARVQASEQLQQQMDKCAKSALLKTLDVVQDYCGTSRRGKNGHSIDQANLVAAVFRHETARGVDGEIPDANFHFHAVIANVAVREDGTTGALDARPLFHRRMKMALGALFRAELSKQLADLGFETHRPQKEHRDEKVSWFELSCVPKPLIDAMSKRRSQIQNWMQQHGLRGAKSAEKAALRTRSAKRKFAKSELTDGWKETCAEFGFTEQSVVNETHHKRSAESAAPTSVANKSVDKLVGKKARFTEIELLEQVAVESQCQGIGIVEIRNQVTRLIESENKLRRLQSSKGLRTFTTNEMLELEASMLTCAKRIHERSNLMVAPQAAQNVMLSYPTLREEQREAVMQMCSGADIACVQGIAGSGKTYMLGVANEVWASAGFKVIGTALSAKATRGLQEGTGITSLHIHKLFSELERGQLRLDQHSVIVIDEAGMIGTRQMARLLEKAESCNSKVVLVGDWKQLQAIDAGAAFRGIAESIGYLSLEEIIRQREDWSRELVRDFRDGHAFKALQVLQEREQLFIGDDRNQAMARLVDDWAAVFDSRNADQSLVFAGTNIEVRELNRMLQQYRLSKEQLKSESCEVDGFELHVGDRILVTKNSAMLGLRNGATGEIREIEGNVLTLAIDGGPKVMFSLDEFQHITLGYAMSVHKGQGVTCENSFILTGDGMTDREISYVEASRARGATKMYSDVLTGGESIQELAQLMKRSRQKELAHEHLLEAC